MAPKKKQPIWLRLLIDLGIPSVFTILAAYFTYSKLPIDAYIFLNASCFIAPLLIIDIIRRTYFEINDVSVIHDAVSEINNEAIKRNHFIDKSIDTADKVISGLVSHLAEDCYLRCSKNSDRCKNCSRFSNGECNGLLRNYLYKTCMTLENAIGDYRKGEFKLATNIREFHTIAIDHLKGYNGSNYSVFHYIGNKELNEENYDSLDAHFLNTLLKRITQGTPAYYETTNFVIKWLLIGDENIIKYNYDYIFYVVEKTLSISDEIMDRLFEFHVISEDDYTNKTSNDLIGLNEFVKGNVQQEPNMGIFEDYFMFIDSTKPDEHGTIYTKMHNKSNGENSVSETLLFFNNAINYATKKKFTELKTLYNNLPIEYKTKTLKERCKLNS
jgi:hypothetical protein